MHSLQTSNVDAGCTHVDNNFWDAISETQIAPKEMGSVGGLH